LANFVFLRLIFDILFILSSLCSYATFLFSVDWRRHGSISRGVIGLVVNKSASIQRFVLPAATIQSTKSAPNPLCIVAKGKYRTKKKKMKKTQSSVVISFV
jgi:hypothetical protein